MAARRIWVVAHRGASGEAPENTLAAYRLAAQQGASFIETDLQQTRDGRVVALHDSRLDRTTDGRGPLSRATLEDVRRLDAGSWFGPAWAGERVPTLEEILALARELDVVFYLELKPQRGAPVGWIEQALVGEIHRAGAVESVAVLSFLPEVIARVRALEPALLTALSLNLSARGAVERAESVGARMLTPRRTLVTRRLVERAHELGLPVVPWTVNEPGEMRRMLALGVDGLITDYPARLVALLNEP